jgi:hypothetical protein
MDADLRRLCRVRDPRPEQGRPTALCDGVHRARDLCRRTGRDHRCRTGALWAWREGMATRTVAVVLVGLACFTAAETWVDWVQ